MALSEFELIETFFRRPVHDAVLGIGDDAALIAPAAGCELAVSTDMLVSGRHFFADADPEAIGHKTLAVNLSDLAAMGARPRWALLGCALPEADPAWLESFARGFFALAGEHGVELIGGDTTRGPLNLCVTMIGDVPTGQALRRSGAKLGDEIYVSGRLGDAALALAHHRGRVALAGEELSSCESALLRPTPRVTLGARLRGVATSCIDISDGLVGDLGHILGASHGGATIELSAVPRSTGLHRRLAGSERDVALECLLAGGDDYELCFTAPASATATLRDISADIGVALTRIGSIDARSVLVVLDQDGRELSPPRAFDHFR